MIMWNVLLFKHVFCNVFFMLAIILTDASSLSSILNLICLLISSTVCYLSSRCRRSRTILNNCCIFLEKSPFIHSFKHQIFDLVVSIIDEIPKESMNLLTDLYDRIFALSNLKYLDLNVNDAYFFP